jgi:hypothetical protein
MSQNLDAGYRAMALDEAREIEALALAEATIREIWRDSRSSHPSMRTRVALGKGQSLRLPSLSKTKDLNPIYLTEYVTK